MNDWIMYSKSPSEVHPSGERHHASSCPGDCEAGFVYRKTFIDYVGQILFLAIKAAIVAARR